MPLAGQVRQAKISTFLKKFSYMVIYLQKSRP